MIAFTFKILGLIIIVGIFAVILNQYRPEYSFLMLIVSSVVVVFFLIENIYSPILSIKEMFLKSGADSMYISVVLKSLGIAYISSFVADVLRENGQLSLAAKAELTGKCAIFILSLPLMTAVLEIAMEFVNL